MSVGHDSSRLRAQPHRWTDPSRRGRHRRHLSALL